MVSKTRNPQSCSSVFLLNLLRKTNKPIIPSSPMQCCVTAELFLNKESDLLFVLLLIKDSGLHTLHYLDSRLLACQKSRLHQLLTLSRLYDVQCHCSRALPLCSERTWFIMSPSRVYSDCDKELYTEAPILEKQVFALIREKLHHARERRKKSKGKGKQK